MRRFYLSYYLTSAEYRFEYHRSIFLKLWEWHNDVERLILRFRFWLRGWEWDDKE